MTCIIGIKDKDGCLWMGADSLGSNGYSKGVDKQPKIFKSKDTDNVLIGSTGTFRQLQLLRYSKIFPEVDLAKKEKLDHEYMVTKFIPELQKVFSRGGVEEIYKGIKSGGTFLIGHKDCLFKVQSDYSVLESADDYDACGSGEYFALGSLYSTKHLKPKERIIEALKAAEHSSCGVQRPFVIINTNGEYEKIE